MQTSDILKKINIPRHKLYYLEQKGYIKPKKITSKRTGDGPLAGFYRTAKRYL